MVKILQQLDLELFKGYDVCVPDGAEFGSSECDSQFPHPDPIVLYPYDGPDHLIRH